MSVSNLVFLHGQPGAGSDWAAVISALPPQLRCVADDRPGYRSSQHPAGSFAANASWLVGELERAGIDDAVLVGHSYGGAVAMWAATVAPERVRALVLVASVGPGCLDGWDRLLAAPVAGEVCALTAWSLTPWLARKRLRRLEIRLGRPLRPDEHVSWETWGNARHEHGAMWRTFLIEERALSKGLHRLDDCLAKIAVPTLVLADPGDKMIPVATSYALRDRIPGARLVLLDRGGHNLPRREPVGLARQIASFVQDLG